MKTFFEPVQGMAGIEEIKKSFSRLGHAVMVSGCIDTQKAHLLEALGEQYPIRVVITSDEVTVFQTVKQKAYSRKTKMRRDLRL